MFSESHYLLRRALRLLLLPYCYFFLVDWKDCDLSRWQVFKDLLYIFFRLKYYPDNYGPCRLWEKDREEWRYYYGSTYNSYARRQLRVEVQPYEYIMLFDDKYICEQLCKSIDVRLPESYGMINGDDDYRFDLRKIFNNANVHKVIIKPIRGHAGRGIYIVKRKGSKLLVQSDAGEEDLQIFVLRGRYIVQAVIEQDKKISEISSSSINTIRVVTILSKSGDVIVVSSSMRFGVGSSYVDNWSSGGIAVGINHTTGALGKVAYDKYGKKYTHHPVSGVELLDFRIPKWELILESAKKVQNAFPYYKLLGLDIALSDDGPVLIEVNANSDIIFQEQTSGPLLKNRRVAEAFDEYNLLVNSSQKDVLKSR